MKRNNAILSGRILISRMGEETIWFYMDEGENASYRFSAEENRAIAQCVIKNAENRRNETQD